MHFEVKFFFGATKLVQTKYSTKKASDDETKVYQFTAFYLYGGILLPLTCMQDKFCQHAPDLCSHAFYFCQHAI